MRDAAATGGAPAMTHVKTEDGSLTVDRAALLGAEFFDDGLQRFDDFVAVHL